jgi:aspartate aminotransferase-like enzyme
MKKKLNKAFRGLAEKLPRANEWARSGASLYTVEVNHARRLRHAYETLGEKGIEMYLESIKKAQEIRKEKIENSGIDNQSGDNESAIRTEGAE